MATIANRVRELREARGLSQGALAEAVGVTRQTIISLEKGGYVPSLLLAMSIAERFGMAVEDVFSKEEDAR
ncbi:helix-turn-helix transcriptional regulator [Gordonibacter sp. An230]|uniref:helix-turn-helix transcriptional regulator n=1 Tax=Gordonibacter sp. An230 TaxID=1965592 RepID=UPI0031451F76